MDEALIHPRTSTIFSARSTRFGCPTIAAFEPQFSTESGVGIDHQADAHEHPWRLSLK